MIGSSALIQEFLGARSILVSGVSRTKDTTAGFIAEKLTAAGKAVFLLHPLASEWRGHPCYAEIGRMPQKPEAAFICNRPEKSLEVVRECAKAGVMLVWLHSPFGTTPWVPKSLAKSAASGDDAVLSACKELGLRTIPGACPMMFVEPVDGFHGFARRLLTATGAMK